MIWRRTLSSGALLGLLAMRPAAPQSGSHEPRRWDRPEVGLNLALGLGRGRFRQFVEAAGGIGGYGALPIALHGSVSLRADLSVLFHEFDSWTGPPSFNTQSYITSLRAGPQLAIAMGRVRFYGFWAGGFSYFATDANPDQACGCDFTQTLHDDFTWVTEVGGGVRVALGRSFSSPALDLGVRAAKWGSVVRHGGRGHAEQRWVLHHPPDPERSAPPRDSGRCERVAAVSTFPPRGVGAGNWRDTL